MIKQILIVITATIGCMFLPFSSKTGAIQLRVLSCLLPIFFMSAERLNQSYESYNIKNKISHVKSDIKRKKKPKYTLNEIGIVQIVMGISALAIVAYKYNTILVGVIINYLFMAPILMAIAVPFYSEIYVFGKQLIFKEL